MEKIDGKSKDIIKDNIEKLKNIFPGVVTEGKIDFDSLKETLGNYADDREERYKFTWNGKSQARQIAQTPSTGTLKPCKEESVSWDTTENLFIEGDNLEVLKLLQKSYHKKVKMIYIDPPYNTGKDFIYKDNFRDNIANYLEVTGQVDSEGKKLSVNSETSGRYHTDWLNMMYPRLKLARNLLKDDGVIFISIDDNEVSNLRKICDEIFGEDNFICILSWKGRAGAEDDSKYRKMHEYIIIYARESANFSPGMKLKDNEKFNKYDEKKGKYYKTQLLRKWGDNSKRTDRPNLYYSIKTSENKDFYPKLPDGDDGCWRWDKSRMNKEIANGNVEFDHNKKGLIEAYEKVYETEEGEYDYKKYNTWLDNLGGSSTGTIELKNYFENIKIFDRPKPTILIDRLIEMSNLNQGDIILDFFSGSATTAHAVLESNLKKGENNKYIMVQIPEPTNEKSEAYKAGYKTIADIGKERIRRVIKKIESEQKEKKKKDKETLFSENGTEKDKKLDLGFKVFKLDSSNIKTWDSDFDNLEQNLFDSIDNIKSDRSTKDVLYEILLKYGLDLTVPIEERIIENKKVYSVGLGALIICLEKDISDDVIKGIIELKEEFNPEVIRVVFSDLSFEDDVIKTNTVQILKQNGIEDVKSI